MKWHFLKHSFLLQYLITFIPYLCLASPNPLRVLPFFAPTGFEASLAFDHSVEFDFYDLDSKDSKINLRTQKLKENTANDAIKKQLKFLAGALSVQQEEAMQGSVKGDYKINITGYTDPKEGDTSWVAHYHFEGTVLLKDRTDNTVELALPIDPKKIWAATGKTKIIKNPQTGEDEYFNPCMEVCVPGDFIEFYFYYFWKPKLPGCPLKEISQVKVGEKADYKKFEAKFLRFESVEEKKKKVTYPRYNELVRLAKESDKIKQGTLNVSLIVGMDDPSNSWRPIAENSVKQDDGGKSFALYQKAIESLGFKSRKWSIPELIKFYEDNGLEWRRDDFTQIEEIKEGEIVVERTEKLLLPTVFDYKKDFLYKKDFGGKVEMNIRLIFTPTGLHEKSKFFWLFYKNALKHHSVIIFDVHSGMGKDLDKDILEHALESAIRMSEKRYQITHFDACSTYGYYNDAYVNEKGGRRYFNNITNGLVTDMDLTVEQKMALVHSIVDWLDAKEAWSFQKITATIDSGSLTAVNGDDDNPTQTPAFPE